LIGWGYACGENRVARLMQKAGIAARRRRRRLPVDQGRRSEHAIAANLLDRDFAATAPNQRWVADFTYIWTTEGWLYFAAVLDLFSRRIVGWSMSSQMTSELVADALMMAIWRRGQPQALLHHSDQGSQYSSEAFRRLLAEHGITCSMSRQGDVWDNSAMESFFSTLKTERVHRTVYRTRDEARADVFDYVERFYNPRRRHSTIGYVSPVEFEQNATCSP
jgi:putative transposase